MKQPTATKTLTLLAALGLGLFGLSAKAQFSDGFEGPGLNPFWSTNVQSGYVVCPSSTRAHSGSYSVELVTTATVQDKNVSIYHSFGAPTYGTVSVWVYDTGADISSGNYISFTVSGGGFSVANIFTADYDLGPGQNGSTYLYGVTNGPSVASAIDRTQAWHQFTLSCLPTAFTLKIDDVVIYTGPGGHTFDYVGLSLSGPYWRPAWNVQFDDFQFTPVPGIIPYTNDAYTVLLDHFDGSTIASILGVTNTGAPCGSPFPSAPVSYSFSLGPPGLSQALSVHNPPPFTTPTLLKYPGGELLTRPNGTMECWVYLTNYPFAIHQDNYPGECEGDLGGMYVTASGQLKGIMWYTVFDQVQFDSGTNLVPLNAWTHIALSWGSAGLRLYINGSLVGTNPNTGSYASWFGQDSVYVFNYSSGNYIDEFRISSIQRTSFNVPYPTSTIRVSQVEVCWNSVTNLLYQVQYKSALTANEWTNLGPPVTGTGSDCITDAVTSEQRFYRVILAP